MNALERFRAKVDVDDAGCWLWLAYRNSEGYGILRVDGRSVLAHRWAYERFVGSLVEGLEIDHTCGVRRCVNPAHLEQVTGQVNTDRAAGHYGSRTHCSAGHEFTPSNTMRRSDGGRRCLECKRTRGRETARRRRLIKKEHPA